MPITDLTNEQRIIANEAYNRDNQDNINRQARLNALPAIQDARVQQDARLQERLRQLANDGNIRRRQEENMPPRPPADYGGKMSMRQKFMNRKSMFKKSMSKRYKNTKRKMSMRKNPKRKSRRL